MGKGTRQAGEERLCLTRNQIQIGRSHPTVGNVRHEQTRLLLEQLAHQMRQ